MAFNFQLDVPVFFFFFFHTVGCCRATAPAFLASQTRANFTPRSPMWHRCKKSSVEALMFHIKVTCQKSFALTRMNSQRTTTFFLNLSYCFFSALRDLSWKGLSLALPCPKPHSLQLSSPSFTPSASLHVSLLALCP